MTTYGDFLGLSGIDRLDREVLLAFVTHTSRTFILAHPETKLLRRDITRLQKLFERRKNHEPTSYLTGTKEFFGNTFFVSRSTLIPRPETELLVERTVEKIKKLHNQKKIAVIDVGTGSGAIIVSLALELKKYSSLDYFATDKSKRALHIAQKNAFFHQVSVNFRDGDLLKPFLNNLQSYETIIIAANLPYLSQKIYKETPPDVQFFEPRQALMSRSAGLAHYEKLTRQITQYLPSVNIYFFFEISPEQDALLTFIPWEYDVFPDYTGRSRLVIGFSKM